MVAKPSGYKNKHVLLLGIAARWSLNAMRASCFSGRAGFSDLHPLDGGWSQNPAGTVLSAGILEKGRDFLEGRVQGDLDKKRSPLKQAYLFIL